MDTGWGKEACDCNFYLPFQKKKEKKEGKKEDGKEERGKGKRGKEDSEGGQLSIVREEKLI